VVNKDVGQKLASKADFSEETEATIDNATTHLAEFILMKFELLNYIVENGTRLMGICCANFFFRDSLKSMLQRPN